MESMIETFRFIFIVVHGFTYIRQEAPKGELGLYIVTDNRNKIYRIKIRSPDQYNFQAFNIISHNHLVADLISIVGTSDFVLGSVDHFILIIPSTNNKIVDEMTERMNKFNL